MVKLGLYVRLEAKAGHEMDVENLLREAHLQGRIAATLMEKAPELLAEQPAIERFDVLAAKLPAIAVQPQQER